MRIAVASGKGGTGKTTLAVALALVRNGVTLADCDVEAPDTHLFLDLQAGPVRPVEQPVPEVDQSCCTSCGICARVCAFHALVALPGNVLVMPQLCHGCGACTLLCPEGAIREVPRQIGVRRQGRAGSMRVLQGLLQVGEPSAVPVIRSVLDHLPADGDAVFDAPPGTSCPVVETVRRADVCLLVTEPTPFGQHDLDLAAQMCRVLGVPAGVVINRSGAHDQAVERLCAEHGLPILMRIPFSRKLAEVGARGGTLLDGRPELADELRGLWQALERLVGSQKPRLAEAGR